MDYDVRRADLVKMSIKRNESGQEIVSECLENKIHMCFFKNSCIST